MTQGVAVGFTSATQTSATSSAAGTATKTPSGPLGVFAALLDLVTKAAGLEPPQNGAPAGVTFSVPEEFAREGAATATTLVAGLAADLVPQTPATEDVDVASTPVPAAESTETTEGGDATPPLVALMDQLAALQDTLSDAAPLDPALEQKLIGTLDAIAVALGIPLPAPPAVDPAISAAATIEGEVALDALATIEAAGTATPPPAGGAVAGTTDTPSLFTAPEAEAIADATGPATPVADEAEQHDLPPLLQKLVEKIGKLAEAIEAKAPALAQRLEALADKLGTGTLDPKLLASLATDLEGDVPEGQLVSAIARLLAPGQEAKTKPEAARFAVPALALPASVGADDAAKPVDDTQPATSAASAEPAEKPADVKDARADAPARSVNAAPPAPAPATADTATQTTTSTSATVGPTTPTTVTAEAKVANAAYQQPLPQQINLPQVAFEIARHVRAGASRFEIRLDPPELGRIDVKLDMDAAGNVNARMTVDRAETLDLMQRDRSALERALAQVGLDSSKTNLEFSLRQNPFGSDAHTGGEHRPHHAGYGGGGSSDASAPVADVTTQYRGVAQPGGVNIFV